MAGVRTVTSVFSVFGLPEGVDNVPAGTLAGGAIIDSDQCLCDCGRIADLDLGGVSVVYDNGIDIFSRSYSRRSAFEWLDDTPLVVTEAGEIKASVNVGDAKYVAVLWYGDSCLPRGLLLVDDPVAPDFNAALRRVRLQPDGSASAVFSTYSGSRSDGISLDRSGVVYASLSGSYSDDYGGLTLGVQQIKGWRLWNGFPA